MSFKHNIHKNLNDLLKILNLLFKDSKMWELIRSHSTRYNPEQKVLGDSLPGIDLWIYH
jgi:hypothetical protein